MVQYNYFLYFTRTHPQWYKWRECRLLRQTGTLKKNKKGHTSGPKFCQSLSDDNNTNLVKFINDVDQSDEFNSSTFANLTRNFNDLITPLCVSSKLCNVESGAGEFCNFHRFCSLNNF